MTRLSYPDPNQVPDEVKNAALKYAYTYIVQELLRQRHNEEGQRRKDGEITEAEFRAFQKDWFDPRHGTVIADLLELRALVKGYISQYKEKINLEDIPIGD